MDTVYFDRNVFADICEKRRGLTEDDVSLIHWAVKSGNIRIPASTTLIEETIGVLRESDEKYDQHIKTVFGLIDEEVMVKPVNELLRDDCYSYAQCLPSRRLMPTPSGLRDILDLSKNRSELIRFAEEVNRHFSGSAANITEGLLDARIAGEERDVGTPKDFNEIWGGLSISMVERVLQRVPRQIRRLCKKNGLKRMLKVQSIRLYTIYYAWLIHSGWFGVQDNPRKMKEGDVGDFFHAVQASVASIFVTQESKERKDKLPYILGQVPTDRFTIMNLSEFVDFVRHKTEVA